MVMIRVIGPIRELEDAVPVAHDFVLCVNRRGHRQQGESQRSKAYQSHDYLVLKCRIKRVYV